MLRITALMDDKQAQHGALIAEHGLSLYVEYNDRRILFDCGCGANPQYNARLLGVDLKDLDAVVLSHSHYDHAAGFRDLAENGLGSKNLYTGPCFFEPKYSKNEDIYTDRSAGFDREFLRRHKITHREVAGTEEIFPGVYLISGFPRIHDFEKTQKRYVRKTETGFIQDDFGDEVCIAFEIDGGLAVLVGCSHPGILNMVCHVRNVLQSSVKAVFGGTHLAEADAARIDTTIEMLRGMGLEILGLSHCSGEAVVCAIRAKPEIQGCRLGVGNRIFFD